MRIVRLPGVHHDANAILILHQGASILIDAGTNWYQALQVERIRGQLDGCSEPTLLLLTSKRFIHAAGASHLASVLGCRVLAHPKAISPLALGDFFTTWANRYDSDFPPVQAEALEETVPITLGDLVIQPMAMPGIGEDAVIYHLPAHGIAIVGGLVPREDLLARWDLPSGSLPDLQASIERLQGLALKRLIPANGPAIVGVDRIEQTLERHADALRGIMEHGGQLPSGWKRPAPTACFHSPRLAWPRFDGPQ